MCYKVIQQFRVTCFIAGHFEVAKGRPLVKFVSYSEGCDKNGDRVSRNEKELPCLHQVTKKLL